MPEMPDFESIMQMAQNAQAELQKAQDNLDKIEVEVECPRCGFGNPVWLRQARLRDVVICRGCKANIQLDDGMNTVRKAELIGM